PYQAQGQTVYLRAKPLIDPITLDEWELPRMMATADAPPQPFNVDQVTGREERVLIFRWEMDAMTAISLGLPAVACPDPSSLTPTFLEKLRDTSVYLVLDSPKADARQEQIYQQFEEAQLPAPEPLYVI